MATKQHAAYCFECLIGECTDTPVSPPAATLLDANEANKKFPLFVTWKVRSNLSDEWRLRGCIGTFAHKPLAAALREYAITSALHDTRFDPIVLSEVSGLKCEVSLLVQFESGYTAYDWVVGQHGITIEFTDTHGTRTYGATYLPEVASEQQWTQQQTIVELVYKAGYRHKCTPKIVDNITVTRFQSTKASCTYQEYTTT